MIWAQNFFEKRSPHLEIKIQNFRKQSFKKAHSMNEFQKILCLVDRHEETDYLVFLLFLAPVSFWSIFQDVIDQKMTGSKKVTLMKNQFFFTLVNLAKKFLKFIHIVALVSWLKSESLNFYFKMEGPFFKKILGSNHYYWLVLWLV